MGHFRVRALTTGEQLSGSAGKPLTVGGRRVHVGLLLRGPVVQRHQLAICRSVLRSYRRASLAESVGLQWGSPASLHLCRNQIPVCLT